MTKPKIIKGFHLSTSLVELLKKLEAEKAVNLSRWVEKVLQKEVTKELQENANGKN